MCDRVVDCDDESDESEATCGCDPLVSFGCASGECLSLSLHCDGHPDCADGDDERDCALPHVPDCTHNQFECHDGACIDLGRVCDGKNDCAQAEDESNCETGGFTSRSAHALRTGST
jgi:low density lipoprotein-related protein 2